MIEIAKLLTKMFDIMDRTFDHPYIVMNKYDEVPNKLPSDLDMCILPEDFNRLDAIIPSIAKGIRLIVVQKIWHGYQKCAYILSPPVPQTPFRLQLDFFTDFSVKHTPCLISYKDIQADTRQYGRFTVPSYRMEYVFLLMRRIFKNDFDEEHFSAIYNTLATNQDECFAYLKHYFPAEIASTINSLVKRKDIEGLKTIRPKLWYELQNLSRRNARGLYRINFHISELKRHWFRIKYPVGLWITLLSPDGGGKSSILERITQTCWGAFFGINRRYFRPHLLRNPGMLNPFNPVPESIDNPDPHSKKPNGIIKSLIRFFYYNLDFILGYFILVKTKCIQKQMVVFDRYYYDYFVDMKRYRYSLPQWFPRVFAWSIPTPDIIFILDGTPEVLWHRKMELPVDEISRQKIAYLKIAEKYQNVVVINVDKPLDDVVGDVTREIILRKAFRTAKAMKMNINTNGNPV